MMYVQADPFMGFPEVDIDSLPVSSSDDQTHGPTIPLDALSEISSQSTSSSRPLPHLPLNLTFGVEFEFIVVYGRALYPPSSEIEDAQAWRMVEVLRHAGIAVNDYRADPDFSRWTVDDDESIETPELDDPSRENGNKDFASIELETPKLVFCEASLQAIADVLDLLKSNFTCITHGSCGLHVHVGNGGPGPQDFSHGFPLKTLKSIATLASVFNRQFNSLHPHHRVSNPHCQPPASNFPTLDPCTIASTINSVTTLEQLREMMNSASSSSWYRGFALNFESLAPGQLSTLEFRQHEATLCPQAVGAAVSLACRLVAASHVMTNGQLVSFVVRHGRESEREFGVGELCRGLGLSDLAEFYAARGLYCHPRMSWEFGDGRDEDEGEAERIRNEYDAMKQAEDEREMEDRYLAELGRVGGKSRDGAKVGGKSRDRESMDGKSRDRERMDVMRKENDALMEWLNSVID